MDDTTYTVRRLSGEHFEVAKWDGHSEPKETYDVTQPMSERHWCNCLGFRRQKYPSEEHKHIVLVRKFIEQGEPMGRVYKMLGGSRNPKIITVQSGLSEMMSDITSLTLTSEGKNKNG